VVHGSVHIVDIETGKNSYVAPGNTVGVLLSGEYRDHLIVMLHKYFLAGGSYDWYWLVRAADGKEIGPIGASERDVVWFREMHESKGIPEQGRPLDAQEGARQ